MPSNIIRKWVYVKPYANISMLSINCSDVDIISNKDLIKSINQRELTY